MADETPAAKPAENPLLEDFDLAGEEATTASPLVHLFFVLCLVATLGMMVWAWFGTLEIVSTTNGVIVPSGQVKALQHLEGGIVREIMVKEGDQVKVDQPLIHLESTISGADVGEITVRMDSLAVEVARLRAEAEGAESFRLPQELADRAPGSAARAQDLFASRQNKLKSSLEAQRQKISQRMKEVEEIEARLTHLPRKLTFLQEQVAITGDLVNKDLSDRFTYLGLLRDMEDAKQGIAEGEASLARAKAAVSQEEENLNTIREQFVEEAREDLFNASRERDELAERLAKYADSLKRTVLRSPVEGIIKSLKVHTVGGVVQAGETIVEIVPLKDILRAEVYMEPSDIGFIQPGQKALVKMAVSDVMRFDKIPGQVVHISPDTFTNEEDNKSYYKVFIETERSHFTRGEWKYQLKPGVQIIADIQIGSRTILEYLLDPFQDSLGQAMRER